MHANPITTSSQWADFSVSPKTTSSFASYLSLQRIVMSPDFTVEFWPDIKEGYFYVICIPLSCIR